MHMACITLAVLLNSPASSSFLLKEKALGFADRRKKPEAPFWSKMGGYENSLSCDRSAAVNLDLESIWLQACLPHTVGPQVLGSPAQQTFARSQLFWIPGEAYVLFSDRGANHPFLEDQIQGILFHFSGAWTFVTQACSGLWLGSLLPKCQGLHLNFLFNKQTKPHTL